jgi:16S rRNA (guanine966-N2)-methyltransferase
LIKSTNLNNQLRLIGGKWRGRKIEFPSLPGLRPTQDRIRETVFNWLSPFISDALCLDLFAGSGALGFEAISRGAKHVVMVDQSNLVAAALKKNRQHLGAENIEIISATVPTETAGITRAHFDIIFLDPPFNKNLIQVCIDWLAQENLVKSGTVIYLEHEINHAPLKLPANWHMHKEKQTNSLVYALVLVD